MNDVSEEYALELDSKAELREFRDRFFIPSGKIYLLGNSLGLMSKPSLRCVERVISEWKDLGIKGWLNGEQPWFYYAESLGEKAAALVGASEDEVICTGTTTVNIHQLIATFYHPGEKRKKILADELNFPTDTYALYSQIRSKGMDPEKDLLLVKSEDGRTLDEKDIVDMMSDEVTLALLPSVLYRSGQLLDMEYLTKEAHKRDIIIGFDCSHSVGVIPHEFDKWGVDFAMWCSYKYMNGGPGSPAFAYMNEKHFEKEPGLAGWFGYVKDKQFDLLLDFESQTSAGCLQISSPSIPGFGAVEGSLEILLEAGIDRIRKKSKDMTSYAISLVDEMLTDEPYRYVLGTPRETDRRGGHVALEREDSYRINLALQDKGVIADFRPPNVIRMAFSPLYNTYHDIWQTMKYLKEIIDQGEYRNYPEERVPVT